MVRAFNRAGWDVVAWQVWGDGGGGGRLYHGGTTDGLRDIVRWLSGRYKRIALIGFSLGGNVVLKYLGEEGEDTPASGAVAISVPTDLASSAERLGESRNHVYENSFLKTLRQAVRRMADADPGVSVEGLDDVNSLIAYDDRYTAPLNGFRDAYDYYAQASCGPYLPSIRMPTLLVNAQNDPFLPASCYPVDTCLDHEYLTLEMPASGGHVGFPLGWGRYWSERRAVDWIGESG